MRRESARRRGRDIGVDLHGVTELCGEVSANAITGAQTRCNAWSTIVVPSAKSRVTAVSST